ncbi:hypothetical protein CLAFUW4_03760 [Fulvia fulva]|uniref:F-box domain-containing protein n=1 Tax=Passalora fulva TaxID=5499 RepID=A0A9Q8LBR2_PASFU|nr:uncharacterized protein CLAFUR5_03733 [Fulvia fulva]KAK4631889.1 hypothetical protein CLAFUR4_03748 [Fulvia fulva]UJO14319.1 hypothetical protein CLAFUR5_03733 [Fulvia fulva]WPV10913.1 hypothetical protein CLAFUW4_03760 [Fulvia fulva]WPV26749.1 hypothetical protein CLAFUW7_03752 [Fulvia fulva]
MAVTSRLESLPPELVTIVLDYIPRPTDLKSLCLTSKVLRNVATPPLYKTAVFDDKVPDWPKSSFGRGFLSLDNPGIAHVRALEFAPCVTMRNHEQEQQFLKRALQVLPRNALTAIVIPNIRCTEDMLSLLCTQQNKLTKISLGPIMFDFATTLSSKAFGHQLWTNLQELSIPVRVGSLQDIRAYHHLVQGTATLSTLNINVITCVSREVLQPPNSQARDKINELLFSRSENGAGSPRLKLKTLTLAAMGTCYIHVMTHVDLSILTSLSIDLRESGSSESLGYLTSQFTKHGASLRIFSYQSFAHLEQRAVLEQFLSTFEGLKKCTLIGDSPDLQSLARHRASLNVLALDLAGYGERVDDGSIHKHIAEHFPSLRVLAINMPVMELRANGKTKSTIWQNSLLALITMPHIQAVQIRQMPDAPDGSFLKDRNAREHNIAAYMEMFSAWSDKCLGEIYTRAAHFRDHLPVLLFRAHDDCITDDDGSVWLDLEPFSLLPAKRIDAFGKISRVLIKGTVSEACYMEPELREVSETYRD